jgi:hypothetical protein
VVQRRILNLDNAHGARKTMKIDPNIFVYAYYFGLEIREYGRRDQSR